ncbi:single-stranded DNA-binding protein, partial [Xanthomonas perforans]
VCERGRGGMTGGRPERAARVQTGAEAGAGGGSRGGAVTPDLAPRRQQPAQHQSAPPMDDFADDDIPF